METKPITPEDRDRFAKYFGGEAPCSTLTEQQLLDNSSDPSQILICKVCRTLPGAHFDILWSSLVALTMTATIPLLIVAMIASVAGRELGKILLLIFVLPVGLFGVWHLVIRELSTDRFWQWSFEKRIDLTTRELVILASTYDRKQDIPVSLKESFPIDNLELHYAIIRNDEYQQVGIYLMPSETTRNIAATHAFNVQGFIYIQNSTQLLYEKLELPDDVVRVSTALSKKTGIKLIQKRINDLPIRKY